MKQIMMLLCLAVAVATWQHYKLRNSWKKEEKLQLSYDSLKLKYDSLYWEELNQRINAGRYEIIVNTMIEESKECARIAKSISVE